MARSRKYDSYRGRRNYGRMMVALVLIGVIGVSLAYLIWGDHGLTWAIFPRFDHADEVVSQEAEPEVELIIEPAVAAEPTEQSGGLLLSQDVTTWLSQEIEGFDFLALTMKDKTGKFYYATTNQDVVSGAIDGSATEISAYLPELLAQDIPVAAFVSILQDPKYATYYVTASALMSDRGYGYKDENSVVWLDPGKDDAIQWVLSVVEEVVALGFDEIVLTDFHYPLTGDLESIRYSTQDKDQALEDLLVAICAITQEAGVSLGMEMASGALVSGSVPYEDWTEYVDVFYAVTNDLPTAQSLVGAENVITMAEQVPVSGDYLLTP